MSGGGPTANSGATTSGGAGAGNAAGAGGSAGNAGGSAAAGSGASASGSSAGGAPVVGPLTIYLAGDSTVSSYEDTASARDQAGWGQMLHEYLRPVARVDNRAVGGRTSRRFIEEGHLDEISSELQEGDYLFVQFGTNDSNKTATYTWQGQTVPYYLEPQTDFREYLQRYIDGARARGATPVLVTPPPRNSAYCTGGNGTGAHAQAMRDLGQASAVTVIDLNQQAVEHLKAICPAPTPEDFFFLKPDGAIDGTHFQENGARSLAGFVAKGVHAAGLPLAALVR